MKAKYIIGISLLIAFVMAFSAASAMDGVDASDKPDVGASMIDPQVWEAQLDFQITTAAKPFDYVVMGEATDGSDAASPDAYDVGKSPAPPEPSIYCYFDNFLGPGYSKLFEDWRHYCDGIDKQWDLVCDWDLYPTGYPNTAYLNWTSADFAPSEYATVFLRDGTSGVILADMLSVESYSWAVTGDGSMDFDITCENASCPTLGDNCYNPYSASVPPDYTASHSTVGMNDDYVVVTGEDTVYDVTVNSTCIVDIILDQAPSGAYVGLYDDCPDGSGIELASATVAKGTAVIDDYTLTSGGEYYILVDGAPGGYTYDLYITLVHDVGVTAINLPTLPVYNDTIVPVQVQVENFGNAETGVPVHVWIEDDLGGGPSPPSCTYEIVLWDTYGDGWDDTYGGPNYVDVLVNSVVVLDDITLLSTGPTSGDGPESYFFSVTEGDTIDVIFYSYGSFPEENYFDLINGYGGYDASFYFPDASGDYFGIADCTPKAIVYDQYEYPNLGMGASIAVDFPDWYVDHGANYTIYAQTELPTDQFNANNASSFGPFYVQPGIHDIGFISVDSPTGHIVTGMHTICGTVENFGDFDEVDCPVNAKVFYVNDTGGAPSDLPFFEDFETASTAWGDWTVEEVPANGDVWERTTDYGSYDDGGATGYAAVMDDDKYGSGSDNPSERLISPVISCNGNYGVMLDFDGDFEDMAGDGQFWVNVSNDGGATFTNVFFETDDVDPDGWNNHPGLPIDISAVADNQEEVVIMFTYGDTDPGYGSGWAWYTHVDNINVYETPLKAGLGAEISKGVDPLADKELILVYEANALVSVVEGGTTQVCFTPDCFFAQDGTYLINLTTMCSFDQFPDNDTAIGYVTVAEPNVYNVDQDTWWTTIQDAVDNADPDDTLQAKCMEFNENVEVYVEGVTIEPYEEDCMPILNGNVSGNPGKGFNISADGVTIFGFEIIGCSQGVYVYDACDVFILNNTIHGNGVGVGLATACVGTIGVNYNHFYDNGCGLINYPAPIKSTFKDARFTIIDEGFEGTWVTSSDPGDPIPYEVPVDPTYGNWDIDGLCVSHQGVGYEDLTHYVSQTDNSRYPLSHTGDWCAGLWWSNGYGGDTSQNEWLITPVMDLSGASDLTLSFWGVWNWLDSGPTDHYYVKASTDGGTSWTTLADLCNDAQYEQGSGGPGGYGWCWNEYQVVLDVLPYASAQTCFAINHDAEGSTLYGIAYTDDFLLEGTLGPTYTLTTNVIGSGSVDPPGGTFPENSVVPIAAIPAPGWVFVEWQGDLTGDTNPTTITMDSDKFVTAVFELVPGTGGINFNWFGYCKPPWEPGCISPGCAINNTDPYIILDVTYNWFEAPDGPSGGIIDAWDGVTVADGLGNRISGLLAFTPWMGINAQMKLDQGGVDLIPIEHHGWLEVQAGLPVFFDGSNSFGAKFWYFNETGEIPLSYYWSFGDQFFSNEESTSHTYDVPGTYEIYLRVSANDLSVWPNTMYDWQMATLYVTSPGEPLAANADGGGLGNYETIVKQPVQLRGIATGGKSPYTYYWSFGDGTPEQIGQNPTHIYTTEGTYTVTLIVQDSAGATASDQTTVVVAGIDDVIANAGGPYEGAPEEVIYIRGSATGGIEPYIYHWEFGDGTSANEASVVHIYEQPGEYTVTLTVTDSEGSSDQNTATVTIIEDHTQAQIKDVKGGLGIKATIIAGDLPVDWSVTVSGKYIFMGGEATGHIDANAIETIKTPFTIAIGNCEVTIIAGSKMETYDALMLGPFAILK